MIGVMNKRRLFAFGIPVTIFVVVFLTIVNFQEATRSSILGDGSETAYLLEIGRASCRERE